ncbi:putative DNA polymerase zeta catalytic subunit, partial [Trypanosoma cruzi]
MRSSFRSAEKTRLVYTRVILWVTFRAIFDGNTTNTKNLLLSLLPLGPLPHLLFLLIKLLLRMLQKGRGMLRATAGPIETRPSVPLLSQVAPSQWGSPNHQPASGVKPKWQPHPSSNASRSVDRGAYMTCDLRVMCVEVLIHRRRGTQNVAQEELLAVALGRTSSFTDSVGVRLFCVAHRKRQFVGCNSRLVALSMCFFCRQSFICCGKCVKSCASTIPIILSWDGSRYGVGPLERRYRI